MKVTTQKTNKSAKFLKLIGWLLIFYGVWALMHDKIWSLVPVVGGVLLWISGKMISWFANE